MIMLRFQNEEFGAEQLCRICDKANAARAAFKELRKETTDLMRFDSDGMFVSPDLFAHLTIPTNIEFREKWVHIDGRMKLECGDDIEVRTCMEKTEYDVFATLYGLAREGDEINAI